MGTDLEALALQGQELLDAGDWQAAEATFRAALDAGAGGEALFFLGDAQWWQGKVGEAIRSREQAYAAFRREGEPVLAFMTAGRLSIDYTTNIGNPAAAAGWLARAERLLTEFDLDPLRGWYLMAQGFTADDPLRGEELARDAVAVAQAVGDLDLELYALSVLGAMLVRQGRVDEGTARLDEAMAGAVGEAGARQTLVFTACNMIKSCTVCADFERAVQWIKVSEKFMQDYACAFLYATCRSLYGTVLTATGEWSRAETELVAALDSSLAALPEVQSQAIGALAELRLAQGQVGEAERLVAGWEDHPAVVPALARMHLVLGRPAAADAAAARLLHRLGDERLDSGVLLELLGEARLALGDAEGASDRATRLVEVGTREGCQILVARGRRVQGAARAAVGDLQGCRADLEASLGIFAQLGLVYEAARTRRLLASALAESDPEVAIVEARAALMVLDQLGAGPEADAAAALLRSLGQRPARSGERGGGTLTDREREVLALVAEGLSNVEIAERLYLSRKTVEHHVARVLAKLGVRNRTEAARLAPPAGSVTRG